MSRRVTTTNTPISIVPYSWKVLKELDGIPIQTVSGIPFVARFAKKRRRFGIGRGNKAPLERYLTVHRLDGARDPSRDYIREEDIKRIALMVPTSRDELLAAIFQTRLVFEMAAYVFGILCAARMTAHIAGKTGVRVKRRADVDPTFVPPGHSTSETRVSVEYVVPPAAYHRKGSTIGRYEPKKEHVERSDQHGPKPSRTRPAKRDRRSGRRSGRR